jgi:hypothetical protein
MKGPARTKRFWTSAFHPRMSANPQPNGGQNGGQIVDMLS